MTLPLHACLQRLFDTRSISRPLPEECHVPQRTHSITMMLKAAIRSASLYVARAATRTLQKLPLASWAQSSYSRG